MLSREEVKKILTKDFLFNEYVSKNKPVKQIAKEIDTSNAVVSNRLRRFKFRKNTRGNEHPSITKEVLLQYYINDEKSIQDIADILGVSYSIIFRRINLFNIPHRSFDIDIINKKFGDLTVLKSLGFKEVRGKSCEKFDCVCICGNRRICLKKRLIDRKNVVCKCKVGYKDIPYQIWSRIIKGARQRNLEFTITIDYIWNIYIKQNRLCALTNIPIEFNGDNQPSLDRIDSSKGYIEGNLQWVDSRLNIMKWDFNQDLFIYLCKKVAKKYGKA